MRRFDEVDAVAVIWWRRSEYPQMLRTMADAHKLPVSFDEWEKRAREAISMIVSQGGKPVQVDTSLDKFVTYCTMRGLNCDAHGRSQFAADPSNWPARSKH
jgi:hypothetical protein